MRVFVCVFVYGALAFPLAFRLWAPIHGFGRVCKMHRMTTVRDHGIYGCVPYHAAAHRRQNVFMQVQPAWLVF